MLDAAPVLGWRTWCDIDKRHGLGVFEEVLAAARGSGAVAVESVETAAQVLRGALNTAARVLADAQDRAAARRQVGETIARLLSGFRAGKPRAAGRPR